MAGTHTRKRVRVRKKRLAIAAVALIAVAALIIGLISIISNRQTLDGADVKDELSIVNNIASITHTEEQRFYDIRIFKPDFDAKKMPDGMKKYYEDTEADFREQLQGLLEEKRLSKKDKATLDMSYEAETFQQFTTYTVNADVHVCEDCVANGSFSRRYAVVDTTGAEYIAADLFKDDYDYKTVLAAKIAAKLEDKDVLGALLEIEEPFTDNVFMTGEGLRVEFDEPVGASVKAGDAVTIEYKYIYYGLNFELPDKYKPPEPNPIDPKKEKVVALTFDDGPSGTVTPKLLDLLDKYGAKATFFVVGDFVEANPEVLKDAAERGHTIGLHTLHHDYSWVKDTQGAIQNLQDEEDMIYEICGVRPYLFRPPGGIMNTKLLQALARPAIIWDVDPQDWKYKDADHVYNEVMNQVTSGDIVLSHDLYESTYQAYVRIIPALKERGYRFVTVDELLGITDPSIEGAYAGEFIYYRTLASKLRKEGKFGE
jgi:peptidoglycan/xylan/chitin deacetylase (PgdA/CDA1 family)